MKVYNKPCVTKNEMPSGIVPVALGAAALSVGGAFAVGVASGLMKDRRSLDGEKTESLARIQRMWGLNY